MLAGTLDTTTDPRCTAPTAAGGSPPVNRILRDRRQPDGRGPRRHRREAPRLLGDDDHDRRCSTSRAIAAATSGPGARSRACGRSVALSPTTTRRAPPVVRARAGGRAAATVPMATIRAQRWRDPGDGARRRSGSCARVANRTDRRTGGCRQVRPARWRRGLSRGDRDHDRRIRRVNASRRRRRGRRRAPGEQGRWSALENLLHATRRWCP